MRFAMEFKQREQYDRKLRAIIRSGNRQEMKEHKEVFFTRGAFSWTVKPPYWHVALGTNEEGHRFLEDDDLDRALPDWRLILSGEKDPGRYYPEAREPLREWFESERRKARRLGMPVPSSPLDLTGPNETEVSRLLRELVKEVRDLKIMLAAAIDGNKTQPMTSTPWDMVGGMGPSDQVHGSAFDSHYGAPPETWYPGAQRYPTAIQPFSEFSGADGSAMSEPMEQY